MEGRCDRWVNAPSLWVAQEKTKGGWRVANVRRSNNVVWRSVTSAKTIADFLAPLPPLQQFCRKRVFF